MREFSLIESLTKIVGSPSQRVLTGIGDDTAVVSPLSAKTLLCSDAMVENIHFDLQLTSPEQLGHKALAACLSDIAAMRGTPRFALFSLALRPGLGDEFISGFYRGAQRLAGHYGVDIVGGDLTRAPNEVFIDVMLVGESQTPALRSTAQVGDLLAVTGTVGTSAAGLVACRKRLQGYEPLVHAHLEPEPRFDIVTLLAQSADGLVKAMIDISDGLSSELHHLAHQSNVGVFIHASKIPLHPLTVQLAGSTERALPWAWSGGEDYQLLMALDPHHWSLVAHDPIAEKLTIIGCVVEASNGLKVQNLDGQIHELPNQGWDHFATNP